MKLITLLLCLAGIAMSGASAQASPKTVPSVDPAQYLGVWYQIAHKPMWFEGGTCACARQKLSPGDNNEINVYNSCNEDNPAGKLKEIRGSAKAQDASNAKYSIDFNLLWKGTYWIIALDPQYRWAVVTDQLSSTAYILSKTPVLEEALYKEAFGQAAQQLDMTEVKMTYQTNCSYPQ